MIKLLAVFLLSLACMFAFAYIGSVAGWVWSIVAGSYAMCLNDSTYTKAS